MNLYATRQARLREIIRSRFDCRIRDFAQTVAIRESNVSRWLMRRNGQKMADASARHIEEKLHLEPYFLDRPSSKAAKTVLATPLWPFGEEAYRSYLELPRRQKARLAVAVESLIATLPRDRLYKLTVEMEKPYVVSGESVSSWATPLPSGIREQRKLRGLSQAQLAKRAGLAPTRISCFETGRGVPSTQTLLKLADAMSCSVDVLLGRSAGGDDVHIDPLLLRASRSDIETLEAVKCVTAALLQGANKRSTK